MFLLEVQVTWPVFNGLQAFWPSILVLASAHDSVEVFDYEAFQRTRAGGLPGKRYNAKRQSLMQRAAEATRNFHLLWKYFGLTPEKVHLQVGLVKKS